MSTRERSGPVPPGVRPRPGRRPQASTERFGGAVFGTGALAADPAKGAGWVVDLALAEWVLRRPARRRSTLPTGPQQAGALS